GGKIRLRVETDDAEAKSSWKDYKAVSLGNGVYEVFFQDNTALQTWSIAQPLEAEFIVLGDGHDGVWTIARTFGGEQVPQRIEVLDWFHLMENLYKVQMLDSERRALRRHLWQGEVEQVWPILKGMRTYQADCLRRYLEKHRHRLPNYRAYQSEGLGIGSGEVESLVKQIGERVKITGARWKPENAPQILRLRTAYLNHSPRPSICA
ncbi:MAG: ISKra4 family transposase, partial [Cyanobacteria bacterium REEB459]|nr:ISKra4 family transposase [Cyanobacteria bacterium REEB459]